jgi:uncharacterized protein YggE
MTTNRTNLVAGLLVLAAAPWIIASTTGADSAGRDSTIVSINGTGRSTQSAQTVTIQAGFTNFETKASRAMRKSSEAIAALRSELARFGIDPKDVRTAELQLSPYTESESEGGRKGFRVNQSLSIVFRDISKSGNVVDALVDAGANQIQGPRFGHEPSDQAVAQARIAAIRDADQRAKFYARALGLRIKRVVTMSDGGGYVSGPSVSRAIHSDAPTVITQGEDAVQFSVSGTYEMVK